MKLTQWLDEEPGRAARLARHFDITPSAVSQWRTNGAPFLLLLQIRDVTGGAVTVEELLAERQERAAA